jgi:hypothetical protein
MNYEKMWNELKQYIQNEIMLHVVGKGESVAKAINCEVQCRKIYKKMSELEDTNNE